MNHDITHCFDYDKAKCPKSCWRGQATDEILNNERFFNQMFPFSHFKNTVECELSKRDSERKLKKGRHTKMAFMEIPIKIELPDNWAEIVASKVIENGDYVNATRCFDCKHWRKESCKMKNYMLMLETDFCSQADAKEW